MAWKVYFWILIVISIPTIIWQGFSQILVGVDLFIYCIAMIGLYGFCWKKKLLTHTVWRIFFPIHIVWNLVYQYFLPKPQHVQSVDIGGLSKFTADTINLLLFVPLIIALYLYAFRRNYIWKQQC